MRHATILDVLRAVKEVAGIHPEVAAWWYAPLPRLPLLGPPALPSIGALRLEIVVEPAGAAAVDCNSLASELRHRLPGDWVAVRLHRGADEKKRLFRLKSRQAIAPAHSASGMS